MQKADASEKEFHAFTSDLIKNKSRFVVIEIGSGVTDPRIRVRPTGEALARENKGVGGRTRIKYRVASKTLI